MQDVVPGRRWQSAPNDVREDAIGLVAGMIDFGRATAEITGYHAHIYYAALTRPLAARLRHRVECQFLVQIGRWHDELVGPHTRSMFQIAFDIAMFAQLVPWLMLNRDGLAVLVHPNTDNPHDDHLVHALWLGEILPIEASQLPRSLGGSGNTRSPIVPNTGPIGRFEADGS